ncbi:MAG: S41 family peptidase [Calditrichaeota bacterium]|nr:MAG: S41 family peptidase [Calditrichota bacterium]
MKRMNRVAWGVAIALLLVSFFWLTNAMQAGDRDIYYKIDKGLFYLKEVFETVSRNYVDEVDPEGLAKAAIHGMLEDFDPYTVFYEDPGSQNLKMITQGTYGGLGMEITMQRGKVTVIAPMDDTPAKRAGIQAGDVISKIDGVSTETMTLEEASQKLRGPVGTQVTIEIQRPGIVEPIVLTLTREQIVIKDVTFAEFIEPGTAYVRLSRFSEKAGKELKQAIRDLQQQGDIERFILDLRGNPGGLLTSAVEVANVFLPQGELVVSTHGVHEKENKFYTREKPLLPNTPLVVLINYGSASASEIVAGAIQDLDRGVIVGTHSFGKGLVQKVYPIDKITQAYLKITTAKYYTPSGRLIQKEDYKKNKEIFVDLSDSLEYNKKINYYTRNGRVVHGGGGIKPDVEVNNPELDPYLLKLSSRGYFFRFAVDYLTKHPELKASPQLAVNDSILNAFKVMVEKEKVTFELPGEKQLQEFLKVARDEAYSDDVQDLIQVALQKLDQEKKQAFDKDRETIRQILEAEFAEKIGGSKARIRQNLKYDQQVKKALEVLHDLPAYQQILAVQQ